jgi:hypothetical protein
VTSINPALFVSSAHARRGDGLMKIRRASSHPPFRSTFHSLYLLFSLPEFAQLTANATPQASIDPARKQ